MPLFSYSGSKSFRVQLFSYSDSTKPSRITFSSPKCQLHLFVFKLIVSSGSLGKSSARIVFIVTHSVTLSISQLNILGADSCFISLKINFSLIVL